jgi:hypothetical protein
MEVINFKMDVNKHVFASIVNLDYAIKRVKRSTNEDINARLLMRYWVLSGKVTYFRGYLDDAVIKAFDSLTPLMLELQSTEKEYYTLQNMKYNVYNVDSK